MVIKRLTWLSVLALSIPVGAAAPPRAPLAFGTSRLLVL